MSYLIVVAHPDDEVLGAGATMHKLASQGEIVNVCILSGEVKARNARPSDDELSDNIDDSLSLLGVKRVIKGSFPNIKFNNVAHLELVQFIEKAIIVTKATTVITHHPADLNNDHLHTSIACQAAVRLYQRNPNIIPIKQFLFMEVPSATDWSNNTSLNAFKPNIFVEIGETSLNMKVEALALYQGVMRPYPHPRSSEAIKGLAAYRGGQAGLNYAESFECVFQNSLL